MDVQIVKFRLTPEESAQALPLVMSAIAGNPTELDYLEDAPSFQPPSEPIFKPDAEPLALPEQADFPPEPQTIPKIAAPTGSREAAKSLVWNKKKRRYVQRGKFNRLSQWPKALWRSADRWIGQHPNVSAVALAIMIALSVLLALERSGLGLKLIAKIAGEAPAEVVLPASLPQSKPAPTPPATAAPGDASNKAGLNGEKPPMQAGALEEE